MTFHLGQTEANRAKNESLLVSVVHIVNPSPKKAEHRGPQI